MSSVPNFAPQILAASGAITAVAPYATYPITVAGVGAFTLAAPVCDGIELTFVDETGHAHTITATALVNGVHNLMTFGGTVGNAVSIYSRNGFWWTVSLIGVTVS